MIVRALRNSDPPGRFLKKDEKTGKWYDIGDKKAAEKVRISRIVFICCPSLLKLLCSQYFIFPTGLTSVAGKDSGRARSSQD